MELLSLQPFVPSGADFKRSKHLFLDLGFTILWDQGDYVGFARGGSRFILQNYHHPEFASNFMLSVAVDDVEAWYQELKEKNVEEIYGIRISAPQLQPYGKEVNMIDLAGVCWHFVE